MISFRLFIEGEELVLNEDVQVAITKQFEDVTNPTVILNDWSKTVNIPICTKNNKIFGHIYNPHKAIVASSNPNQKLTGIYFDPTKKLSFRLDYGSTVVMVGYAKMNSVTRQGGKGTYNITLNGELGKIFQELNKITFDSNSEESDYIIDGSKYIDTTINKTLVKSSWTSTGQTHTTLSGATITDIIGFAPNNSYYEEFDPKSFQNSASSAMPFTEVLKTKWDNGNGGYVTGIDPETAIPDGLLPRDIGEFRSYYQTPYIYWNKLWQIVQNKSESITGYTWELDKSWFTTTNPYWYNLVYMLKPFNVKDGTSIENHYTKWGSDSGAERSLGRSTTPGSPAKVLKLRMPSGESVVQNNKNESYHLLITYGDAGNSDYDYLYPHYPPIAVFKCPEDFTSITFKWTPKILIETPGSCHFKDNAGLIITMKLWGCDDWRNPTSGARLVQTNNYIIRHEGSEFTYSDYTPVDTGTSPDSGSDKYRLYPTWNANFHASLAKCGPYCYFTIEGAYTTGEPFYDNNMGNLGYFYLNQGTSLDVVMSSGAFRSGARFTLNDLWDNTYNVFDQILNYCKMYRILIFADHRTKKLKFIPFVRYFKDYTITDWTDKVDMSKDFIVTPLTFDNKYILFNYKDNDSKLGEKYKETWGVNYGEKRIITNYNFNQEEKNLFEKDITSSITNTDFSLSWSNLYGNNLISYSLPAEIFPYAKDDDKKKTDNFGAFYFHNGRRNFDTTAALNMRSVSISDDTTFQQSNSTYYYSQDQDKLSVTTYPALDIISSDGDKLCVFNTPSENFTYAKNLSGTKGIYDLFWKGYLNERYNIQNKQVTCYIHLDPTDFINFEYRNFVKIDDMLYMVNKIYDYNIASNNSTKVDLITVQDVTSYYVDYISDFLNISTNSITLDGSSGTSNVTVNAYNNEWNFEVLDKDGNIVTDPIGLSVTKSNNNTLTVVKTSDRQLNYSIRVYTRTKTEYITVKGARSLYIRLYPVEGVTVRKNHSDEFDITVETNFSDVNMLASSTVQWYRSSDNKWYTTAFQAASYVPNFGSGSSTTYNEDHEDRSFTIHVKIVNPTADGKISFFESTPVTQYYYFPYSVINEDVLTLDSYSKELDYSKGGTWGVTGESSSDWSWELPQGVSTYGGLSGVAGPISTTFTVASNVGTPGTNKVCKLTNTEGMSVDYTISF